MERVNIPESYRKPTHPPPTTPTYDEWKGIPYRPNDDCRACKGAGFVHPVIGGRVEYSQAVPCRAQGCLYDSMHGKVVAEAARQTFETFKSVAGAKKALEAAMALAYGRSEFVWLLIYGPPGNGKTHLCRSTVKVMRDRGFDVRMVLAADLFSQLRQAIEHKAADQMLQRYKNIFFLAIDDYGVEYNSEWEQAKFDELMTARFAASLPTVIITNKDISQLPDRIRSRFEDTVMSRAIGNTAPDYRKTRK